MSLRPESGTVRSTAISVGWASFGPAAISSSWAFRPDPVSVLAALLLPVVDSSSTTVVEGVYTRGPLMPDGVGEFRHQPPYAFPGAGQFSWRLPLPRAPLFRRALNRSSAGMETQPIESS